MNVRSNIATPVNVIRRREFLNLAPSDRDELQARCDMLNRFDPATLGKARGAYVVTGEVFSLEDGREIGLIRRSVDGEVQDEQSEEIDTSDQSIG